MKYLILIMALVSTTVAADEMVIDFESLSSSGDYEGAIGAGIYQLKNSGVGYYGNAQITASNREPLYEGLNTSSFGDPVTGRCKDLVIVDIGVVHDIMDYLYGYAGVGYVSVEAFARKYDPYHILANNGNYYVPDSANNESGINLNLGLILKIEQLTLNAGYHSFTGSKYVGVGLAF